MKILNTAIMLIVTTACLTTTTWADDLDDANATQIEHQLVGTWELVSMEYSTSDGKVSNPFGESPLGRIQYDPDGNMYAFVIRRDRPQFSSGDLFNGTPDEIYAAFEGSVAYYGTFTIQESEGTVTHHVAGASFPNRIGTDQVRYFQVKEDQLILRTPLLLRGGVEVTATVVWMRI